VIDDDNGRERLRASIGQLYYIDDRTVTIAAPSEEDDENTALTAEEIANRQDKSDIFAELTAPLTNEWDLRTFLRFDQDDGDLTNITAGFDYDSGTRRFASVDYFKNDETSEDLRFRLDWPLAPRVQLETDHRYSIQDDEFRANSFGLVYDGCCWAVGLKATRILQSDGEFRDTILATLELDGLGKIQTAQ
jgi:LPS-assembly protein